MATYQELIITSPDLFDNDDSLLWVVTNPKEIKDWEDEHKLELLREGKPEAWGKIGIVYEDQYILVLRDLVKFPSGLLSSYFRILNKGDLKGGRGAVILPIINNKILLLRQYRHATRKWHWEIPRGFGEPNTSPEENAKKEIIEEIDGEIIELIDLGPYHSNTGIEGVNVELYLAKLLSVGKTNLDEGINSYQLFDVITIEKMISDSRITDGFTIAAFARSKFNNLI